MCCCHRFQSWYRRVTCCVLPHVTSFVCQTDSVNTTKTATSPKERQSKSMANGSPWAVLFGDLSFRMSSRLKEEGKEHSTKYRCQTYEGKGQIAWTSFEVAPLCSSQNVTMVHLMFGLMLSLSRKGCVKLAGPFQVPIHYGRYGPLPSVFPMRTFPK